MAPGPKKRSFLTPRNNRNNQSNKLKDEEKSKVKDEPCKNVDTSLEDNKISDNTQQKKYSKRLIESNWNKYEESPSDPHCDYVRGQDIEVALSYSGGSQLKLLEEKGWESDSLNYKDISLNLQDLTNSLKCIPFHQRMNIKNYFTDKHIEHFISTAENWKKSHISARESQMLPRKEIEPLVGSSLAIIEEPDLTESNDVLITNVIKDKTVNIINSLASNLTFKEFSEKEKNPSEEEPQVTDKDVDSDMASNDLDFLLSLNISSKVSDEKGEVTKPSNVDDWLNSILDG